jgi:myo-inositol-1(or 4)-monophosphatase
MEAADKPRNISRKEGTDIVTATDNAAEEAITKAILAAFPDHAVLGEEAGLSGNHASSYLWVIDPLDGTVNFTHSIPGFNVSVGVLRHATPVAGCVVEFVGAPGAWTARTYWAHRNGGAFCDGKPIQVSRTRQLRDAVVVSWKVKEG